LEKNATQKFMTSEYNIENSSTILAEALVSDAQPSIEKPASVPEETVSAEMLSEEKTASEGIASADARPRDVRPRDTNPHDKWEPLRAKMRERVDVNARVVKWQRNGLEMELVDPLEGVDGNVNAFMPNDLIDRDPNRNIAHYFGKTLPVKITSLKARPGAPAPEIVVNHRAVLEEEARNAGREAIKKLNVGDIVQVKVKSFDHDNVVVDLGPGIDSVIRLRDLSWKPVDHPYEVLKRGETVSAKILGLDRAKREVNLGIRQLTSDPELELYKEYASGQTHRVKVAEIVNAGAEVELPNGLIAFLPISEIAWQRIASVSDAINIGDEIEVKLLTVDPSDRRITASRKQLLEDPMRTIENTFRLGTDHNGTIKEVNRGGVVVALEHGVEGFVPRRELSHDRIERLEDSFKAGKPLEGLRVIEYERGRTGEARALPKVTLSLIAAEKEAQMKTLKDYRANSKDSRYSLADSLSALRDKLVH
jgi:ribosomal protein S1